MTVFTRIMCPYSSWLVWILLTSWFPFRGYFFSKNNFLVLTFWNLKNQTPPVSRDAGKSCDWVKVKTKTRFKATFQIRIPLMIHNSLRLKRQEDIYKPRKTDSFCENFLIWVRNTLISMDSSVYIFYNWIDLMRFHPLDDQDKKQKVTQELVSVLLFGLMIQ